jgi:hypothetical protein
LFEIGDKTNDATGKATISGYIRDAKSGEPVIGASVFNLEQNTGVTTDQYGYYSLTLPKGRHVLKFTSIGMTDTRPAGRCVFERQASTLRWKNSYLR